MMSAKVSFGLVHVVLFLSTFSLTQADVWPEDDGFYDICEEIIDDVNGHLVSWIVPVLAGDFGEDVTTTFK